VKDKEPAKQEGEKKKVKKKTKLATKVEVEDAADDAEDAAEEDEDKEDIVIEDREIYEGEEGSADEADMYDDEGEEEEQVLDEEEADDVDKEAGDNANATSTDSGEKDGKEDGKNVVVTEEEAPKIDEEDEAPKIDEEEEEEEAPKIDEEEEAPKISEEEAPKIDEDAQAPKAGAEEDLHPKRACKLERRAEDKDSAKMVLPKAARKPKEAGGTESPANKNATEEGGDPNLFAEPEGSDEAKGSRDVPRRIAKKEPGIDNKRGLRPGEKGGIVADGLKVGQRRGTNGQYMPKDMKLAKIKRELCGKSGSKRLKSDPGSSKRLKLEPGQAMSALKRAKIERGDGESPARRRSDRYIQRGDEIVQAGIWRLKVEPGLPTGVKRKLGAVAKAFAK